MFFELKFYIPSSIGKVEVAHFPLVPKDLIESCICFVDDNFHSTFHTVEIVNSYDLEIGEEVAIERLRLGL